MIKQIKDMTDKELWEICINNGHTYEYRNRCEAELAERGRSYFEKTKWIK